MMKTPCLSTVVLFAIVINQYLPQVSARSLASEGSIPQLPGIPVLIPSNEITEEVHDCLSEKFDEIEGKNPKLRPWLRELQQTASTVSIARHNCDTVTGGVDEQCLDAWKRNAGSQVLRVGLAIFEYKDLDGSPLELLSSTLGEFQSCWS